MEGIPLDEKIRRVLIALCTVAPYWLGAGAILGALCVFIDWAIRMDCVPSYVSVALFGAVPPIGYMWVLSVRPGLGRTPRLLLQLALPVLFALGIVGACITGGAWVPYGCAFLQATALSLAVLNGALAWIAFRLRPAAPSGRVVTTDPMRTDNDFKIVPSEEEL